MTSEEINRTYAMQLTSKQLLECAALRIDQETKKASQEGEEAEEAAARLLFREEVNRRAFPERYPSMSIVMSLAIAIVRALPSGWKFRPGLIFEMFHVTPDDAGKPTLRRHLLVGKDSDGSEATWPIDFTDVLDKASHGVVVEEEVMARVVNAILRLEAKSHA